LRAERAEVYILAAQIPASKGGHMFKAFILLRIPISMICMIGYSTSLAIWKAPAGLEWIIDMARILGPFVLLGVVSFKLARQRPDALTWAGVLLALEVVGAVLMMAGGDYVFTGKFEPMTAFGVAAAVLVAWTLPNVALLYKWRGKFVYAPETRRLDERVTK
jgi:hypothetical protein